MIWIIIFSILFVILGFAIYFNAEDIGVFATGVLMTFGFIFIVGLFFSTMNHASDLESIQYHTERIEIQTERVNRLEQTLESFSYPEGALLNKDSPVASIVNQISDAELAISEAKEQVVETERDIRARHRWAFGFSTGLVE